MKYKVKIQQCMDPQKASAVAGEMSSWSGSTLGAALDAIMTNSVTLQQELAEDDARALAAKFEALGAETELIPTGEPAAAAVVAAPIVATALSGFDDDALMAEVDTVSMPAVSAYDDDDDDEEEGRVLSDAEYVEALKSRPDVFQIEKKAQGRNIQLIFFLLALGTCFFMATREVIVIAADFFERLPEERTAQLVEIDAVLEEQKEEEEKKEEVPTEQKKLRETKSRGVSASAGGGDPRARVTKMGVLAAVSGSISNTSGDLFAQGGFATDIDAILSGVGGLRQGGDGGTGRQGVAGIGFGSGFGSGFGGGGGGLDLGSLMSGGGSTKLKAKKGDGPQLRERPTPGSGAGLTGGRTMQSIRRVVMQNMGALRHAYNRRLREKPDLNGVVTVRFSIDEFGTVISATMTNSTVNDQELERTVVERVRSFVFERIDIPGDITEVTYPFAFTQ
jgi:TonB family protein